MTDTLNMLYFGDNLDILRRYIKDETVDLIYLDPPFNSQKNYNVLFKMHSGTAAAAQIESFKDTWHWNTSAAAAYKEAIARGGELSKVMRAFYTILGSSDMLAYLAMMAPRLVEMHRVLKKTGSLYLHCDATASHYLKLLLDAIFGTAAFHNEIVWKRSAAHNNTKQGGACYGRIHDVLFFYTKSGKWTWNPVYTRYSAKYIKKEYRYVEERTGRCYSLKDITGPGGAANNNPVYEVMGITRPWRFSQKKMSALIEQGRILQPKPNELPKQLRYLDEMPGVALQDIWADIPPLGAMAKARLGYSTQKPEALIARIIQASSHVHDLVLDPFCGCGTTIRAADKLNRHWIGIDIAAQAISIIEEQLQKEHCNKSATPYNVLGAPTTLEDAHELAKRDRWLAQCWILYLLNVPATSYKKGADGGTDGRKDIVLADNTTHSTSYSVKSGKPRLEALRDLRGVVARDETQLGVFVTFTAPTRKMRIEAAAPSRVPLQLLTVEEILQGKRPVLPQCC